MRFNFILASALTVTLVGSACGNGVRPETRDTVRFSALETDSPGSQVIADPGPTANAQQLSTYEPIVQGVRDNRRELFSRADVGGQLERIEGVFIATGEYLELVRYYQDHAETAGVNDDVGRRLAWAMIRLGQKKQSREIVDALLEAAPNDPLVHFLDGSFYLQTERDSVEDRKKAIAGWSRAIELDPNFRGYEGITSAMMLTQLQQLESSLAKEEPPAGEAAGEAAGEEATPEAEAIAVARSVESTANRAPDAAAAGEPTEPIEAGVAEGADAEEAAEAQPAPTAAEAAPTAADSARQYKILVARGELALSQQKFEEAENFFIDAKKLRPDGFAAELGQLQAGWGVEAARNVIARRARTLAERDLSGEESLRLGQFVWTRMQDRELARRLLEEAKKKSPERARAADAVLEALNP